MNFLIRKGEVEVWVAQGNNGYEYRANNYEWLLIIKFNAKENQKMDKENPAN